MRPLRSYLFSQDPGMCRRRGQQASQSEQGARNGFLSRFHLRRFGLGREGEYRSVPETRKSSLHLPILYPIHRLLGLGDLQRDVSGLHRLHEECTRFGQVGTSGSEAGGKPVMILPVFNLSGILWPFQIDTIVTIGGLYGRFDHVMGCIHTLFLLQKEFPKLIVYCLLNRSMFTLLPPVRPRSDLSFGPFPNVVFQGSHTIHVDLDATTGVCGLVPIGGPAKSVTTSGLEWNLSKTPLTWG